MGQEKEWKFRWILEDFLNVYMVERDVRKTLDYITEDVYSVGTGAQEVARNKEELKALVEEEIKQIPESLDYCLDSYEEKEVAPGMVLFLCNVTTTVSGEDGSPIRYSTRFTTGFKKVGDRYLGYHFHMSEASGTQEESEYFPVKHESVRYDRLTGLLNRTSAENLIENHLKHGGVGTYFLMDIDNFKLVNDMKGHPAGDRVLNLFATRLKDIFKEEAIVARLGGDEFIAFVSNCVNPERLISFAKEIVNASKELVEDIMLERKLGVSIGIAIAPRHGKTIAELYPNADKAQYYAKRNGKNRYSFYEHVISLPDFGEENQSLQTLRRAVQGVLMDKGAFTVEYDTFGKICNFVLRNESRLKYATQILLFSLEEESKGNLGESRKLLEESVRYGLRMGDLMMDFSERQIAVLLINCGEEDAAKVANRIATSYETHAKEGRLALSYEWGSVGIDSL